MEQHGETGNERSPIMEKGNSQAAPYTFEAETLQPAASSEVPGFLIHSAFASKLIGAYGWKLLVALAATQHLAKGFVFALVGAARPFLFKKYHVPATDMQIYGGIISLPWAMKPVIGLLSDCLPISGYNKAPYIIFSTIVGTVSCAIVGRLDISVMVIVICMFMINFNLSTVDVLTEAKYAERMRHHPESGPDLMTYVWFGLSASGLIATVLSGPVIKNFGPEAMFLIAIVPLALMIFVIAANYLEEEVRTPEAAAEARAKMFEQNEACFLCLLMFVATSCLAFLGIVYQDPALNCAAALFVAFLMLVSFSVVLRPVVAKVNAFFLIQTSCAFSISGASFYFYTDGPEMYKDGPHFSTEFFTSVLGTIGIFMSMLGLLTYNLYLKDWKYRHLLLMANVALSAFSVIDVIMYTRLNVKWGVPDKVMIIGASIFETVIFQWMWMPGVVINSQLCPKGMEATMYALLAGCHNLGNTVASCLGAYALKLLGCIPAGQKNEDAQFDSLWIAALISGLLPFCTLALLPWLIPDAKQTERLLPEGEEGFGACEGSLLRQWLKVT